MANIYLLTYLKSENRELKSRLASIEAKLDRNEAVLLGNNNFQNGINRDVYSYSLSKHTMHAEHHLKQAPIQLINNS